jgi:hypothetical protein
MSTSDVPPDEMGWDPNATDDALERMLSGQAPTTDEWRELAGFVEDLNEAVPARPLASEDLHVAAMVETSHLTAEKGDPVARPVSNADAPAPQVSRLPKLRRKPMKRSTRTLVRALVPVAAVLTVMGSMAVAGALPHTVQKAVSHAAGTVGLNLPGDESTDVPGQDDQGRNADDQGDNNHQGVNSTSSTAVTTNDQGDQGESSGTQTSADDQGENDDSQGDNNNQGEDTQSSDTQSGDSQSGDSQGGDTSSGGDSQSGDTQSGDSQGDTGGDTQSGDSQGGNSQGD